MTSLTQRASTRRKSLTAKEKFFVVYLILLVVLLIGVPVIEIDQIGSLQALKYAFFN